MGRLYALAPPTLCVRWTAHTSVVIRDIERDTASRKQKKPEKKTTEQNDKAHEVSTSDSSTRTGSPARPANFF